MSGHVVVCARAAASDVSPKLASATKVLCTNIMHIAAFVCAASMIDILMILHSEVGCPTTDVHVLIMLCHCR